ncbi:FecR family protein [Tamlana flava]|uniref:FecR family protein n=1 Tax=Tamlana flava TaxID=3158572 RepID=UPI00351BC9B4
MEFKLIIKKLNNKLTPEEEVIFSKWFNESRKHKDFFTSVKSNYKIKLDDIDVEKAWLKIQDSLNKPKKERKYWKYAAAAIVVGLVTTTYFFKDKFSNSSLNETPIPVIADNPILPGSDKAILTLDDGSSVELEKGNSYNSQTVVSNGEKIEYNSVDTGSREIKYNYLTIPRGGQFYVILSDGTKVWLNSETQLKYPVAFVKGLNRQVELVYGEAYFDVSPSSEHNGSKFIVTNNSQEVEVLGTEFNIKAYKDENNVYTTLVEGRVMLDIDGKKQNLSPNEQSNYDTLNGSLNVEIVDVDSEISWKNGVFSFKGKPLKEIMKVISRWYDVEVIFKNKDLEQIKFKGILSKHQSIEEILSIITSSSINKYEIVDKKIFLE